MAPSVNSAPRSRRFSPLFWLDLFFVILLFGAAMPIRLAFTKGDLWLDEGDYAAAAVRGFEANRWDISDSPSEPEKMARLRHYHPPLTALLLRLAMWWGPDDRTLRTPSVVAGCLTVPLLYVCSLSLFIQAGPRRRRGEPPSSRQMAVIRGVSLACAVVLLATPAHLRGSSHALPWSLITLWLLALLWSLLRVSETEHPGWLAATGLFLGALFVTSEYAVPALLAVGLALPFAAWPILRERQKWRALAFSLLAGAALFGAVAWSLWPAGLTGGIIKMLRHYADMATDVWPVRVHGVEYDRAPKTAYVVWYWDLFKPYLVFYGLGLAGALVCLLRGRGTRAVAATLAFAGVVVSVAHASHIIGPEYLVHALPLLTLLGGLFFIMLADIHWLLGTLAAVAAAGVTCTKYDPSLLSGMDSRSLRSRWPGAARFLADRWQPGDRMLAPSYGGVGRWYVLHVGRAKAHEWQILGLPGPGERISDSMLYDIRRGIYRYVAAGSTFSDYAGLDSRVTLELEHWKVVWRSDEGGTGPSRLVLYERLGPTK